VATERGPDGRGGRLWHDSDELLAEVDELKKLEADKRQHEISSPEFQYLADRIAEKSREIFRLADDQRQTGNALDPAPPRGRPTSSRKRA
jgi:hypothetical protein